MRTLFRPIRVQCSPRCTGVVVGRSDAVGSFAPDPACARLPVLEVLEPGAGQLVHYPADEPLTYASADFVDSMHDAWTAAWQLAQAKGISRGGYGRWRLLRESEPVLEVSGRSASGAAARGWYYLLSGLIADEGVIVLAAVNSDGVLTGVDGVTAKVEAIFADKHFDTIVVASDDNEREATRKLRARGKSDGIRVRNLHASDT